MKMPPHYTRYWLATSALGLMMSLPAFAQTAPATTPNPPPAQAQPAPAKPAAKPAEAAPTTGTGEAVETVTVTAARPLTKIDRDVYDPKTDPDTPVSSAADALNKAPGVQVDAEGNVTLRGNSNVQVYINGKPSARTEGNFRGMTLQSMPAEDIDTVEVMTNPGAQYGAEGGAGIININLRPGRGLRPNLFVLANAGSFGRYMLALQGGAGKDLGAKGTLSFSGGLNIQHGANRGSTSSSREYIRSSGNTTTTSGGNTRSENDNYGLRGNVEYAPNQKDSFTLEGTYNQSEGRTNSKDYTEDLNAAGLLSERYDGVRNNTNEARQASARLGFNHKGDQEGETFRADLRVTKGETTQNNLADLTYQVTTSRSVVQENVELGEDSSLSLSADYTRPLWNGIFSTGFDLNSRSGSRDASQYDTNRLTGIRTLNARRTNSVVRDQDQREFYVNYQRELSEKWNLQGGLRVEETHVSLNRKVWYNPNPSGNDQAFFETSYVNYHPSFAAQYVLSPKSKIRYNYSHRVSRPNIDNLNPAIIYNSERSARQGNPRLKPAETHANELRYEYNDRAKNFLFSAVYFYRVTEGIIVNRTVYIDPNNTPTDTSDDVLLTSVENGGEGVETGMDFQIDKRWGSKFSINIQSTAKHETQPPRSSTVATVTEQDSVTGRIRARYSVTPRDTLQLTLNAPVRTLNGQGYTERPMTWQGSYSRPLNAKLTLTFTAQGQGKARTFTSNETVRSFTERDTGGTTFMVGLRFNPFGITGRGMGGRGPGGGGQGGGQGGGNWGGGGGGNNPGGGF
ncbi:TonB-dependent receptor [Asticcacaulis sp. W401b]|uniref:TonB-dependent receptor n=1 Tax=Asticcacaulis sp. W401b TaxID=3388666 RepID=UPI0039711554